MPTLIDPRYEAFAQARAKGFALEDAYEDAGFVSGNGHANRLARRPEVAARIAELRAAAEDVAGVTPQGIAAAMLRLAETCLALNTPAAAREARECLLEARNLMRLASDDRRRERDFDERKLTYLEQLELETLYPKAAPEPEPASPRSPRKPRPGPPAAARARPPEAGRQPETAQARQI